MHALSLTYKPEDDWHGELFAVVESGEFRGCGSAWFSTEQLRAFHRATGTYPLTLSAEPKLEGGYYDETGMALKQCHLSIQLTPHDPLGAVRVTVSVSTQASCDDDRELRQSLTARFLVNYGDIDRFRVDLAAMLESAAGEAVLTGALWPSHG
jgi:hypothetical protein